MTKFRPCIDLHAGKVKQIVGGSLKDHGPAPTENFVSGNNSGYYAELYRDADLPGGHVIQLGPGNEAAAKLALETYPGGLQLGGGVTAESASQWLDAGASHVIVTSWLFDQEGHFLSDRLDKLVREVGVDRLVIDLSCRKTREGWTVAMNRWQTLTNLDVTPEVLDQLAGCCDEFLIHAADVEGLCGGIDGDLVTMLGEWGKVPMTYAGGVAGLEDVRKVQDLSGGKVDVTVGSALDIFGGTAVRFDDLVKRLW